MYARLSVKPNLMRRITYLALTASRAPMIGVVLHGILSALLRRAPARPRNSLARRTDLDLRPRRVASSPKRKAIVANHGRNFRHLMSAAE